MNNFFCKIVSITVDNVIKNFLALVLQCQSIIPPKIVCILQNSLFTLTVLCVTNQRRFSILHPLSKLLKEFFLLNFTTKRKSAKEPHFVNNKYIDARASCSHYLRPEARTHHFRNNLLQLVLDQQ